MIDFYVSFRDYIKIVLLTFACFQPNCVGQQISRDSSQLLCDLVEIEDHDKKKLTIDATGKRLQEHTTLSAKLNITLECVDGFYFPARMLGAGRELEKSDSRAKLFDPFISKISEMTKEGYWELGKQTIRQTSETGLRSVRIDYQPDGHTVLFDSKTHKLYLGPMGDPISWLDTPEHFVELYTNYEQGQLSNFPTLPFLEKTSRRIAFRKARKSFNRPLRFPNVESYLRVNESISFVEALEKWKTLVDQENSPLRIYSNTKHVVFRLRMSDGGERFLGVDTLNSTVDFYDAFDSAGRLLFHREHKFLNGTVFPSSMVDFEASARPNGPPIFYRELTLIAEENTNVRKADFSIEQIGLKYGERIVDEIENRLLILDHGNKLTPAENFRFELRDGSIGTRQFLLYGGIAAASLLAIYTVSRRKWAGDDYRG